MSNITERLKDAVDQFPAIEDHPYTLFFDSLAEIERLQAQVAELECMVKVFRGCIYTQTLPGQGSRCHKKVYDLVGDPDDGGGCDA